MPNGKGTKADKRTPGEKAANAQRNRQRLGVVNPFSYRWRPLSKDTEYSKSHPSLQKV